MGFRESSSSSSSVEQVAAMESNSSSLDNEVCIQMAPQNAGETPAKSTSSSTRSMALTRLSLTGLSRNVAKISPSLSFIRSRSSGKTSFDSIDIINAALELGNTIQKESFPTVAKPEHQEQQPEQQLPRRVHFELSCNQVIPSVISLTDEDITNSWWSSSDSTQTCHELRESVMTFRNEQQDVITDFIRLVSQCKDSTKDVLDEEATNEAAKLVPTSLRGCEIDIAPMLRSIRRKHMKTVVECSKKIPKHMDPGLQSRMLASRSVHLSRTLKVLATIIGRADEVEAML